MTLGPTNIELADALEQMADLLVRTGESNPYRVQAYLHAATTVRATRQPLAVVYGDRGLDGLRELPGVGDRLARHLAQYLETGRTGLRDRLLSVTDPAALLATLPSVSYRLGQRLVAELGVTSLAELERAALDGRLLALDGIGPRTVEAIRLQLNSILSRTARRRARRVRRQVMQIAAAHPPEPPRPEPTTTVSSPVTEPAPPMATIYPLFPSLAA